MEGIKVTISQISGIQIEQVASISHLKIYDEHNNAFINVTSSKKINYINNDAEKLTIYPFSLKLDKKKLFVPM